MNAHMRLAALVVVGCALLASAQRAPEGECPAALLRPAAISLPFRVVPSATDTAGDVPPLPRADSITGVASPAPCALTEKAAGASAAILRDQLLLQVGTLTALAQATRADSKGLKASVACLQAIATALSQYVGADEQRDTTPRPQTDAKQPDLRLDAIQGDLGQVKLWQLTVLVSIVLLLLLSLTDVVNRRRNVPPAKSAGEGVADVGMKNQIVEIYKTVVGDKATGTLGLHDGFQALAGAIASSNTSTGTIGAASEEVPGRLAQIERTVSATEPPGDPSTALADIEKRFHQFMSAPRPQQEFEVLDALWLDFLQRDGELGAAYYGNAAELGRGAEFEDDRSLTDTLKKLPIELKCHPELSVLCGRAVAELRRCDADRKQLAQVARDLKQMRDWMLGQQEASRAGGATPTATLEAAPVSVARLRAHQIFMQALMDPARVGRLRDFALDRWVRGEFLVFADRFFREYEEASAGSGSLGAPVLAQVHGHIVKALKRAGLEPIRVEWGRTAFEAKYHMVRSRDRELSRPDGVVLRVLKTGFVDQHGQVTPAEVVVNKH